MLINLSDLAFETGASVARKAGTSEITVSRLLRRLGYRGMAGLKRALQKSVTTDSFAEPGEPPPAQDEGLPYRDVLDLEMQSLAGLFRQFSTPLWSDLVAQVVRAETVYTTGFQTVRGAAEDFSKRLALARDSVRFIAAHDGMLAEWIGQGAENRAPKECMVLIDVVPYAAEAEGIAELCHAQGRGLVVFTDESCHWARKYTDFVIHAQSRNGLFLESTGTLTAALNVLVHAVAEEGGEEVRKRLERWRNTTRKLAIF
jgi:DNA-binding MurR/RpiR family transcriptional regulator